MAAAASLALAVAIGHSLTTAGGSAVGAGASHDVHDATARSAQLCPLEGFCHGDWGEGMQNHLRCTLKDVLLDSYFIAQVLPRALGLRCLTPIAL